MDLPQPDIGQVIRYEYLWHHESVNGQENGAKGRPCAVVMIQDGGVVKVVPITHTQPEDISTAVELPPRTRARLGLDNERAWVVCSEMNEFVWPGPDIQFLANTGSVEYGALPRPLFINIVTKIQFLSRGRQLSVVARTD